MNRYTPAIYGSLMRPFTLDLGPTADQVSATRVTVDEIRADTRTLSGLATSVTAVGQHLQDRITQGNTTLLYRFDNADAFSTTLLAAVRQTDSAVQAAQVELLKGFGALLTQAGNEIIQEIKHTSAPALVVGDVAAPLIRLLIQAQANALDGSPGEIYAGKETSFKGWLKNDVELQHLKDAAQSKSAGLDTSEPCLWKRCLDALEPFKTVDMTARSARYAKLDALIHDICAALPPKP
jgi:hypothetical protein